MIFDEEEKAGSVGYVLGTPLDDYSIEELTELVDELAEETQRLEEAIAQKKAGLVAAQSIFK